MHKDSKQHKPASKALANGGLFRDDADSTPISLQGTVIESSIFNACAKVHLTQAFTLPEGEPASCVYMLPIFKNACVTELALIVDNDTLIVTNVIDQAKAFASKPLSPGQQQFISLFKSSPFHVLRVPLNALPSQKQIQIKLTYVMELGLTEQGDALLFTLPGVYLSASKKEEKGDSGALSGCKVTAKIILRNGVQDIEAQNGHSIKTKHDKRGATSVSVHKLKVGQDLTLVIKFKETSTPYFDTEIYTKREGSNESGLDDAETEEDGRLMGVLSYFPPLQKPVPAEIIFLVDRSSSMKRENRVAISDQIVKLALEQLTPESYFQVVTFGATQNVFFSKGSTAVSAKSVAKALEELSDSEQDLGGTALLEPLKHIFERPVVSGCLRSLFIITDGEIVNIDLAHCLELLRKDADKTSTRTFAIGVAPGCPSTILGLARAGRGKPEFIPQGSTASSSITKSVVAQQVRRAVHPSLQGPHLEWGYANSAAAPSILTLPRHLPSIFPGEPYHVYAVWPRPNHSKPFSAVTELTILTTSTDGKEIKLTAVVGEKPKSKNDTGLVHKLAVANLIEEVRDWEGLMGLQLVESSKQKEKDKPHKHSRVSKGEMTRMAARASIAASYLNTCLVINQNQGQHTIIDLFDPDNLPKKEGHISAPSVNLHGSAPVPTQKPKGKLARPPTNLRDAALKRHDELSKLGAKTPEPISAKTAQLLYSELEGIARNAVIRELTEHAGYITPQLAKFARSIVQDILKDAMTKFEFELIDEASEQAHHARRPTTNPTIFEEAVVRAAKRAIKNMDAASSNSEKAHDECINIQYLIASHTETGSRPANEDVFVIVEHVNDYFGLEGNEKWLYIGLYDGHLGISAAKYAAAHLHINIIHRLKAGETLQNALIAGFSQTDYHFNERAQRHGLKCGTTAMSVFLNLTTGHVIVANCGDAKAILCTQRGRRKEGEEETQVICHIQHPDRPDEKQRIEKAGGKVVWFGAWRVNGHLAVARSIGDPALAHLVVATPELFETHVALDTHEFILLATDGLWDVIKEPQQAAETVREMVSSYGYKDAAKAMCDLAISKGSTDNVTVILIFLGQSDVSQASVSRSTSKADESDPIAAARAKMAKGGLLAPPKDKKAKKDKKDKDAAKQLKKSGDKGKNMKEKKKEKKLKEPPRATSLDSAVRSTVSAASPVDSDAKKKRKRSKDKKEKKDKKDKVKDKLRANGDVSSSGDNLTDDKKRRSPSPGRARSEEGMAGGSPKDKKKRKDSVHASK